MRAILFVVLATILFSLMHACIRHVSAELHPFEIAFFRNLFAGFVLAPWFIRHGLAPLRTTRFPMHGLRGLLNIATMLCFFYALSQIPLADVAALSFAAPIFATALAVPLLGEKVGIRRWAAIFVGFAGTLVVLRPGFTEIGIGSVAALVSAFTWGVAIIVSKSLARTESSVTITSYMMVLLTPMSFVAALFVWQWPEPHHWPWLVAIGLLGTTGHLLTNQAFKDAEAQVVLSFDFLRLAWVSLIGYFAFAEVPDALVWLGGAMIFASAAYVAERERRARRRAKG